MTLESKESYPQHTKIVQNSLGFMPEVKPLHKPRGDLVLCAHNACVPSPVSAAHSFLPVAEDITTLPLSLTNILPQKFRSELQIHFNFLIITNH